MTEQDQQPFGTAVAAPPHTATDSSGSATDGPILEI